jgi:uncharacterized protein YeaO (DUF488 family)
MIKLKRAYDPAARSDGSRYLVDRLWPRGVTKDKLHIEGWLKSASPSNDLRHWYGHEPGKWKEFQRRYAAELDQDPMAWQTLLRAAQAGDITLVYSARNTDRNNAVALKAYLERKTASASRRKSAKRESVAA